MIDSRITVLSAVLLVFFLGGCGSGYTITASRPSSWPTKPGVTPEEARAEREAEVQKYLAGKTDPDVPSMFGVIPDKPGEGKDEQGEAHTAPRSAEPPAQATAPAAPPAPAEAPRKSEPPLLARADASQASRYGDLLFVSGQLPLDAQGKALPVETPVEEQARLVLQKLDAILGANRLTMANVVSMTVYLTDLEDLAAFDAVAPGFFKRGLPPRSVVGVARLPNGARVQVSAVAGR